MRRILVAVAVLLATAFSTSTVLADATPVQLMLLYVADVSNTGTPGASGVAELVLPEGEVRVSATGLPALEGSNRYAAWLVNSESNQYLRLGSFNANENDAVHFEDVLPEAIPNKNWNLLLVTVESELSPSRPSNKHSIAGVFPRSDREAPPELLPNTGGADDGDILRAPNRPDWLPVAGLATLTLSVGLAAGYGLGKR
jgi:hypothetical protein